MPYKDFTLYANWTPITYKVKFHSNDGIDKTVEQTITYDKKTALSKNTFTKTGYTFSGWSESANGEIKYTDEKEVKNLKERV